MEVYFAADNIFSPLGRTTEENFSRLKTGETGVKRHISHALQDLEYYASLFSDNDTVQNVMPGFTKFENILSASITDALIRSGLNPSDPELILVISSTKGNISLLEQATTSADTERMTLHHSAKRIAGHFDMVHPPVIVSSACISGILALITGRRLLQSGKYKHAVVAGADLISTFILSGFHSFQAISAESCKPFDADRKGINLGEGAATIVLSTDKKFENHIRLTGGSVSNDANHISGPSRTGEELSMAISKAMKEAGVKANEVDFISAHGTATLYNDEMEAKAIGLAGLEHVPVNSLKGYFGHTLGAAGLIETAITLQSMKENLVIPTKGFQESGVSKPIEVCRELRSVKLDHCLKTASGFGGCNAAIVLSR